MGDRTEEEYLEIAQQLMDAYCTNCHPYGDRPDYPLETYEQVYQAAEPDQGPSIGKLAKFTHFHAFGMGVFAFLLSGKKKWKTKKNKTRKKTQKTRTEKNKKKKKKKKKKKTQKPGKKKKKKKKKS